MKALPPASQLPGPQSHEFYIEKKEAFAKLIEKHNKNEEELKKKRLDRKNILEKQAIEEPNDLPNVEAAYVKAMIDTIEQFKKDIASIEQFKNDHTFLFVSAHCTQTITDKINELKENESKDDKKLIVGIAASPFNMCRDNRGTKIPYNDAYSNKINLPIFGATNLLTGQPIEDLLCLLEPNLSEKGMPTHSIISNKQFKKLRDKVAPLINYLAGKFKVTINDDLTNSILQNKIKNPIDTIKVIDEDKLEKAINNNSLEEEKEAVNNLINFYNDVVNKGISDFQENYFNIMKNYSPKRYETKTEGFYHPNFVSKYFNLEVYLTNFGFSDKVAKAISQVEIKTFNNGKVDRNTYGNYSIRWLTKFIPALDGCLGDIYNFIFFVQIINYQHGGLQFINKFVRQGFSDNIEIVKQKLYKDILDERLNIDKSSEIFKYLTLSLDNFCVESIRSFIKHHKHYNIKPKFLIEDGELDDLLCSLTLKNLLNRDAKIFRQVPHDDHEYITDVANKYYEKDIKLVENRIKDIHNNNNVLDKEVELLKDKFNRHIIDDLGGAAYEFLNIRTMLLRNKSLRSYKELDKLLNTYMEKANRDLIEEVDLEQVQPGMPPQPTEQERGHTALRAMHGILGGDKNQSKKIRKLTKRRKHTKKRPTKKRR